MRTKTCSLLIVLGLATSTGATAQVTFYANEGYRGPAFRTDQPVKDLRTRGFNDRASSAIVDRGRWEACEDTRFRGRCVVLRPGRYDSLQGMGLNDRISSVRRIDERRDYRDREPDPNAEPAYEYRQRPDERVFDARVTSVHAVMGPPERRCWVEREEVGRRPNVGGAVVGALLGGIIGHQVGSGRGRDVATVGGAVVGGAIGSQAGGSSRDGGDRDVQHCEEVPGDTPAYWDVGYEFHDEQHRVQMSAPPGDTIRVNSRGEPRQ
jgi:uncharacterized protein YcfJ